MAEFYEMPAVSPTMETGTLVEWKIAEGEAFESGAVVAEVGTDKANMEAEIFDKGVLLKHLVHEGDEVPPGFPIAIWGTTPEEDVEALLQAFEQRKTQLEAGADKEGAREEPQPVGPPPKPAAPEAEARAARPPAAAPAPPAARVHREWHGRAIHHDFADPPGDLRYGAVPTRVAASPLARKVAADLGVELQRVKGTGPGGRIVRADVEQAQRMPTAAPEARPEEVVRHSSMRKTIARRMTASHQQIPTFFLTADLNMAGFVQLRSELKARLPDQRISYNDMLLLAVARALRDHPEVNASWGEQAITRHGRVDLGIAVALPDGLITPVLRNADRKSLSVIASEVRELASRARELRLAPEEYTGSTFTVSNLGMLGIEHFTAIINPPDAAILAVGEIRQAPVLNDGKLEVAHRMKVTMTCDHRVIDGAVGATFLQTVRRYVESPWLLLV